MSVVAAVTVQVSCVDEDRLLRLLGVWAQRYDKFVGAEDYAEYSGGTKHPQTTGFNYGINYLPEDVEKRIIQSFRATEWYCPENAILLIQPEDGPTEIYRPTA